MKTLRAVFFDLDDTLVLTHEATRIAHDAVKLVLGARAPSCNAGEVVETFVKGFTANPWDPLHQMDVTEWRARIWNEALQKWNVEDMQLARELQACFDKERMLAFQWASGVDTLVNNLQSRGIKVGLITNGHAVIQRAKLTACKAEKLFEVILVGGEEPLEKPHREIFLKACELAGCDPGESLAERHLLLLTCLQGGINAGFLATVWVNLHGDEHPENIQPTYTISSITELPQVLEKLDVEKRSITY